MERLYNNIILPDIWPPRYKEETLDKPLPVPYLENKPDYIDISIGRQLFVDDFLISHTDLIREFPSPKTSPVPALLMEACFMILMTECLKCGTRPDGLTAAPMPRAKTGCIGPV